MNSERIGFIGLGNMGHPMALNLERSGSALSVYNRNPEKTKGFSGNTRICSSIAELVAESDIVFTMITDDNALHDVYGQILNCTISGKLFVDMSTVSRVASQHIAGRLMQAAASFIDAPVAGSTKPAAEGTLLIMAGGTDADVQRAMPFLLQMGKEVKHLGAQGSGLAAKIAVNYFLALLYQGLAESVLLGEQMGVSRADLLGIINESACGSGATRVKTPLLVSDNYTAAFALDLMLKDIRIAGEAGARFPLGNTALATYESAQAKGLGQEDVIGIIRSLQ